MAAGGVHKIIEQIEKTAEGKVSGVMSAARQKADGITGEAKNKAAEQERAIVARGEQEARRESQRILAEARIQARRARVKAQEDVVKQSFAQAKAALQQLADAGSAEGASYKDIMQRLIVESIAATDVSELEVLVRQRDRDLVSGDFLNSVAAEAGKQTGRVITLKLSDESVACMGGAAVRSLDGRVRVDNTFEARTDRFVDVIRTRVAKELFPQE